MSHNFLLQLLMLLLLLVSSVILLDDGRLQLGDTKIRKEEIVLRRVDVEGDFMNAKRRVLAPSSIRISIDFKYGDLIVPSNNSMYSLYQYSKTFATQIIAYYGLTLQINTPVASMKLPAFPLVSISVTVPAQTVVADIYIVFVPTYSSTSGTFASAAPILVSNSNGRAVAGEFDLNLYAVNPVVSQTNVIFSVFLHELFHIFAFNDAFYGTLRYANGSTISVANTVAGPTSLNGISYSGIILPNSVAFSKAYLNDNTLTQVLLEVAGGSGSAGSHWAFIYWPTDFMHPVSTNPALISKLSLSLAQDTGWYTVNFTMAEEMTYGQNAGANYQNGLCPSSSITGFCSSSQSGVASCSPDYTMKTRCVTVPKFGGGCYYNTGEIDCTIEDTSTYISIGRMAQGETSGKGARCMKAISSGNAVSMCGAASCDNLGTTATWKYVNDSVTCTCPPNSAGSTVTCTGATSLSVICPDTADFCNRQKPLNRCPNDCSSNGRCLGPLGGKFCFCMYGYMGDDCSVMNPSQTFVRPTVSQTSNNNSANTTLNNINSTQTGDESNLARICLLWITLIILLLF